MSAQGQSNLSPQPKHQAFHGTYVTTELDPAVEPQNVPTDYDGPPLTLLWSYVGRDSAEPTLGVDKDGTAFYAADAFDAYGTRGLPRTEVWRSDDGGVSFFKASPTIADQDIPPHTLDPYVYVDRDTGRVFSIDLQAVGSFISYSDDKGETWQQSFAYTPQFNDHQSFSTAPPPEGVPWAQPTGDYPNLVWYCVNHNTDAGCSYSLDGGVNFIQAVSPAIPITDGCSPPATHGHLEGAADGTVYLPSARCGRPTMSISSDAGMTWDVVSINDKILQSTATFHTAVAVDAAGNVYSVWFDRVHHLPWLSTSTDKGQTWTEPLLIAPPGVRAVNYPEIIAGDEGRIAISFPGTSFNDTEAEPHPNRPWDYHVVVSTNALDENPLFVSSIGNDPDDPIHRGLCEGRCKGMFDFIENVVSPHDGSVWSAAIDTCLFESGCATERGTADMAFDFGAVSVRQLGGPWLVGATPRAASPPGTLGVPAVVAAGDGQSSGGTAPPGTVDEPAPSSLPLPVTGGGLIGVALAALAASRVARRRG